jgi:hybrid cluster-associated redox disulfide protein
MITKDTPINEVLRRCPAARDVFARHGMGCIGCMGAANETVAGGARMHEVDVEKLVEELNKAATQQ